MSALEQYISTTYWGIIVTGKLVQILFIAFWIHTHTMTKRYKRLEERFDRLERGMVTLRDMLQPPQQKLLPLYITDAIPNFV